jgi:ABC-2 type transport system ATP-binding protein
MRQGLRVEGLSTRFSGFHLQGITFDVKPGEIVGLLGENGAGKTTTLRLIMGMLRKDAGGAHLGDLDHLRDEKAFKRRVGYVSEESFFYRSMSVARLLAFVAGFFPDWDAAACAALLGRLGLDPARRVGELSKGMRTKLALVVALARRPDVLILDEPTSGLDPRSRVQLFEILERSARAEGCAVLLSSHIVEEIDRTADRVVILAHGRVVVDERLPDLRALANSDREWSLERYFLEMTG